MKRDQILDKVANLKKRYSNLKVSMIYWNGKYTIGVMLPYSGGEGLGYMGKYTILEILYNTKESAEITLNKIKSIL